MTRPILTWSLVGVSVAIATAMSAGFLLTLAVCDAKGEGR